MMKHLLGIGVFMAAAMFIMPNAQATHSDPHKITLCHRTNSETNPYVVITVDVASVRFEGHDGHSGPVWQPGMKADGIKWGDIIPPFSTDDGYPFNYPGKNWTEEGQDTWSDDCTDTDEPTPTVTTPPPCEYECSPTPTETSPPPSETESPSPSETETPTETPSDTPTHSPSNLSHHSKTNGPKPSPTAFTGPREQLPLLIGGIVLLLTAGTTALLRARSKS